jgi:hypothetical protein
MTTMLVSANASSAFYTNPATGTDLSAIQVTDVQAKVKGASDLAQAIRDALASAHRLSLKEFQPASSLLILPADLTKSLRETLFNGVMESAYNSAPLSLQQWSQAVERLEAFAAQQGSSLPPGKGGGAKYYGGTWYLNGEPISFAMLFVASRVNAYDALDTLLAGSLNTIAANSNAIHVAPDLLKKMRAFLASNSWTGTDQYPGDTSLNTAWGEYGGLKLTGFAAWEKANYSNPQANIDDNVDGKFSKSQYSDLIDRVQTYFDSKTADNQIAQLRMESVMNSRANLLDGMSSFMKGQQNSGSSVSRNI